MYNNNKQINEVTIRARVPMNLSRFNRNSVELVSFDGFVDSKEHFACVMPVPNDKDPLVRLHSECITGDLFGSKRCDCGFQLNEALEKINIEGGVLLYLRQEGRGIGLFNKLDAYLLQDQGADTFEANRMLGRDYDERSYEVAANMLKALGKTKIRLMTNNPDKIAQLMKHDIYITEVIPTKVYANRENLHYLVTKATVGGHSLHLSGEVKCD